MQLAQRETRFTENRLSVLPWVAIAAFVFLFSGFWRLQVLEPEYYSQLAERNHIKNLPIPAARGRILDRNHRVLVDNYPSFSIIAQWSNGDKAFQGHLPGIAAGLEMDPTALS